MKCDPISGPADTGPFIIDSDDICGSSHDAEPGAEPIRSVTGGGAVKCRMCGDVDGVHGVMASPQRGAGDAGSPKTPLLLPTLPLMPLPLVVPLRDRGTSGGSDEVVSKPELRFGKTGSMRG